jgi:hypothetical protein
MEDTDEQLRFITFMPVYIFFSSFHVKETGPLDTSFGSGGLPDNLLNATEDYNGPIALGDEVSQAYSSNNNVSTFEPQFENGQFFPGDESHVFSSNPVPVNPNRQQGIIRF